MIRPEIVSKKPPCVNIECVNMGEGKWSFSHVSLMLLLADFPLFFASVHSVNTSCSEHSPRLFHACAF